MDCAVAGVAGVLGVRARGAGDADFALRALGTLSERAEGVRAVDGWGGEDAEGGSPEGGAIHVSRYVAVDPDGGFLSNGVVNGVVWVLLCGARLRGMASNGLNPIADSCLFVARVLDGRTRLLFCGARLRRVASVGLGIISDSGLFLPRLRSGLIWLLFCDARLRGTTSHRHRTLELAARLVLLFHPFDGALALELRT